VERISDEYERYCAALTIALGSSPLAWWLEPTQQAEYLNLSRMAIDMLSIPTMSVEAERLFSGAKI
jgi:hypothetical protein